MKLNEEFKKELLEELSSLEHEQWILWAKNILEYENISKERRTRWEKYFVPYGDLEENVKNLDRVFARKSLKLLEKKLVDRD